VPIAVFGLLLALLFLLVQLSNRAPIIEEITPKTIAESDTVEIRGRYFEDGGKVTLGARELPEESVLSWSAERIRLRPPEDLSSGLVYVETENGRSEGVFVSVESDLPELVDSERPADAPYIAQVTPEEVEVGDLVTITGRRFGSTRNEGRVLFRWARSETDTGRPPEPLPVSEFDYGYEYWSERRIEVRVPDGAVSGALVVETEKGASNERVIEVSRRIGSKTLTAPRSFATYHEVAVQNIEQGEGAGSAIEPRLYLWVSKPQTLPAQRDVQLLRREGGKPLFAEGVPGLMLYELGPESFGRETRIGHAYLFRRYAVETAVVPQLVRSEYDMPDRFMSRYTSPNRHLPVATDWIEGIVRRVVGRGQNPYENARRLYNYTVEALSPLPEIGNIPAEKGVEEEEGNAFTYATLYTSLLRQADVPARLVAGALFSTEDHPMRHYWSEFYIDGVGWIPADPALADGLHQERFETVENRGSYYFGNLDERRVAFSVGQLRAETLSPHGTQVQVPEMYALQEAYEEQVGPIESYDSRWYSLVFLGDFDG
jgi:hypothetical protein